MEMSRRSLFAAIAAPLVAKFLPKPTHSKWPRNHREAMALQREHNHAISGMMDELRLSLPPLSPELVEQAHRDINSMLDRWNREPLTVPICDPDGTVHRVLIQS